MGSVLKPLMGLFGLQTGGVRDPYSSPYALDPVGTKENITKLLQLYGELVDALRTGNTDKFLSAEFQSRMEQALVPLRAQYQTARTRLRENLVRQGVTDPVAQERLMSDLERQEGSEVAKTGRFVTGERGDFIRSLLGLATQFTGNQQSAVIDENRFKLGYNAAREQEAAARSEKNASQIRSYWSMIAGAGGGGGMFGGGASGGGGGFSFGDTGYNPLSDSISYGGYMEA